MVFVLDLVWLWWVKRHFLCFLLDSLIWKSVFSSYQCLLVNQILTWTWFVIFCMKKMHWNHNFLFSYCKTEVSQICKWVLNSNINDRVCASLPAEVNRISAVGSDIAVFFTSPVVSSSRGPGQDRGPQSSVKWEVSDCWKLSKTLTGSDALGPSGNNENIWSCYFPQFTSEWVVAGARLPLHPPERSQEGDRGRTAPQRACHLCSQTKPMLVMFHKSCVCLCEKVQ